MSMLHGVMSAVAPLEARRGAFATNFRGDVYVVDAAANNPGAAGGALTDSQGRLLGMLGKELRSNLTGTWLNYALPVAAFAPTVDDMLAGRFTPAELTEVDRPDNPLSLAALGIVLVPDVVTRTPPYIDRVLPNSPAAAAGLRPDDLVVMIDAQVASSCREAVRLIERLEHDAAVRLAVLRGEEFLEFTLTRETAREPPRTRRRNSRDARPNRQQDSSRDRSSAFSVCILHFAICNCSSSRSLRSTIRSPRSEEAALKAAAEPSPLPSCRFARSAASMRSKARCCRRPDDRPRDFARRLHPLQRVQFRAAAGVDPRHVASGKQAPAELVATDHSRMLVLLKVSGVADLPVPSYAPADEVVPGQWAVAMGRTFRADRMNVSVGIVSAIGRMFGKVIQTDADVSTANYGGPLVDIRGRVLGIIVPMAPQQGASEVAGAEWYDSGIGFAVPLAPLAERIEQMKKGEDQRAGLLGIGMTTKNPHSSPAELAAVRPDSPAGKAGFKKGDRIVEINGKPIQTQTDMRFALGTVYGGDSVRVVAMRGDERLERTIKLVGEMPAFRHAFLGILPMRPAAEPAPKNGDDKLANE